MKKIILIILALALLPALGCDSSMALKNNEKEVTVSPYTQAPTQVIIVEPTATATLVPEALPDKPKYIFIVIGDGMGQGAASFGEIYARIEAEDMDAGAVWESFEYKRIVEAGSDSSAGGTRLATGYKSKSGYISLNNKGERLYTILDRAHEAGMGTGVITNSSLADATPAVFIAHTESRYDYGNIISQTVDSDVDFMAGGGLRFFGNASQIESLPKTDCYCIETYYKGGVDLMPQLEEEYSLYYGMEGAVTMLERLDNDDYPFERAIYPMSMVYMPWEIDKYRAGRVDDFDTVPDLCDMTKMGIETLYQNPNGFVMMVEEAFIDKAAHEQDTIREIYQVKLLNDTMKTIMEFYNQHPNETLVILTADHETGNYMYSEELMNEFKQLPDFKWQDDRDDLSAFLQEQWNFRDYESYYYSQLDNAQKDVWESEDDARVQVIAAITDTASIKYGTIVRSRAHSSQDVPLYATGNGSDIFAGCVHIAEVPIFICNIMEWRPLPEVNAGE